MKLYTMIVIMVAIQVTAFFFYFPNFTAGLEDIWLRDADAYTNITIANDSVTGLENLTDSNFWNTLAGYNSYNTILSPLVNYSKGSRTLLISFFLLLGGAILISGIYANRNEMFYLTIPFMILLGVGIIPTMTLHYMVTNDVSLFVCGVQDITTYLEGGKLESCFLAQLAGFLTAGMLYSMWVLSCIEWWSARSTV